MSHASRHWTLELSPWEGNSEHLSTKYPQQTGNAPLQEKAVCICGPLFSSPPTHFLPLYSAYVLCRLMHQKMCIWVRARCSLEFFSRLLEIMFALFLSWTWSEQKRMELWNSEMRNSRLFRQQIHTGEPMVSPLIHWVKYAALFFVLEPWDL